VDRTRAVGALAPTEARVHDGVAQRLGPRCAVDDVAQPALVVGPALVGPEVRAHDHDGRAVARRAELRALGITPDTHDRLATAPAGTR
jgi:hypothetical protein